MLYAFLLIGLGIQVFVQYTVHSRPLYNDELIKASSRTSLKINFWIDNGFLRHCGFPFLKSPYSDPHTVAYRSHPPALWYPLYWANFIRYKMGYAKFSLRGYTWYNQSIVWLSASLLGYLVFRLAIRLCCSSLLAFLCGVTSQAIFQTNPWNLERYFESYTDQLVCLFFICLLLNEEASLAQSGHRLILKSIFICLSTYIVPYFAIPALCAYVLSKLLISKAGQAEIITVIAATCLGFIIFFAQICWVRLKFPDITSVGSTFLYRTGLDGATDLVGLPLLDQLGKENIFLRNVGIITGVILIAVCLLRAEKILKETLIFITTAAWGFYLMSICFYSKFIASSEC